MGSTDLLPNLAASIRDFPTTGENYTGSSSCSL